MLLQQLLVPGISVNGSVAEGGQKLACGPIFGHGAWRIT